MADNPIPVPQLEDPVIQDAPPVVIPPAPVLPPPTPEPELEPEPVSSRGGTAPVPEPEPEPEPEISPLQWIAGGHWRERLGRRI